MPKSVDSPKRAISKLNTIIAELEKVADDAFVAWEFDLHLLHPDHPTLIELLNQKLNPGTRSTKNSGLGLNE